MNIEKNNNILKKQISINMLANIVSYSTNILISFVLTPFLINTIGKETYSFYPMANTIVGYMSVLSNAMNSMASRFVTVSLVQDKKEDANRYFSSTLAANLIMSAALVIPMVLVVVFLEKIMEVPINSEAAIKGLFALVFSSTIVYISTSVFGIATFAKNRIDLRSLRELVTAILRIVLFLIMYQLMPPSIIYVGVVTLAIAVVNVLFQVVYTKMLMPEISLKKKYISIKHTKELLSSSCWNAINTFGNTLLAGMSMILANMFYGASASGAYSIVNTVPQFINGVIVMLVGVFYPIITYKYAQNDKEGLIKEIKVAQSIVGMCGCSVIAVFSALAREFFSLWTPGEDSSYLALISFLTILPHFVISCMWSLSNLNVVMNKVKVPAIYTLVSGGTNVLLAFFVYKIWSPGLISLPIISTLLQIMWIGVFVPQYACKNLNVGWNTFYTIPFKAIICSMILLGIIMKIKTYFELNSWIKLFVFGIITGFFTCIILAFVLIGKNKICEIIRSLLRRYSIKGD